MDKEMPRRAIEGIISVIIKNNEEKTKETAIFVEGYIKAVRDIFGEDSLVVDKSRYFNITSCFIIYTYVRLYFTVSYHYFYYEWRIGQSTHEIYTDKGERL